MLYCKKLDPKAILPTVAHPGEDLAYDLYAIEDVLLTKSHHQRPIMISTGIAAKFVKEETGHRFGLLIRDRSSMASKGIITSAGVIDSTYTGEIKVLLTNHGPDDYQVHAGDKIAQMIPISVYTQEKVIEISEFPEESSRANKGFGSSGR